MVLRRLSAVLIAITAILTNSWVASNSADASPPSGTKLDGLAAYWSFDSSSEFETPNLGGSTLTRGNGASWTANGKFGGALSLNGSSQSLYDLTSPTYLPTGNSSYTQSVWFNPTEVSGGGGLVGWGNYGGGSQNTALRMYEGSGGFRHYWWGNDLDCSGSECPLTAGTWYHVASSWDGTTRKLYLDGELKKSDTPSGNNATAEQFHIGKTCCSEYFNGLIDDVAIYNRALTATEILAMADPSAPTAPVNSVIPAINGTLQTGDLLSSSTGMWSGTPTSYNYRWLRASTANSTYSVIPQATSSTLSLTDGLVGDYIKVEVSAVNAVGEGSPALSASVGPVTDLPLNPTPTLGSTTSTSDGFTVSITNYSSNYTYSFVETAGSATHNAGLVTVTGVTAGSASTVTVRAARSGYRSASANVTGNARGAPVLEIVVNATPSAGTEVNQGQASVPAIVSTTNPTATGSKTSTAPKATTSPIVSLPSIATTTTLSPGGQTTVTNNAPSIPIVSAGQAGVQVGDTTEEATVSRTDNQLIISAGPLKATLASINDAGNVGALDDDGNVQLKPGDGVRITLAGFEPNSNVEAWLFSTPILMGNATVKADGTVSGLFAIPEKAPAGAHRIAVVARTKDGKPATLTVGVMVGEQIGRPNVTIWLIISPLLLAILGALTLPATRRRRKARVNN